MLAVGTRVVLLKRWQDKRPGFILNPGALGTIREVAGDEYVVEFDNPLEVTGRVKADMIGALVAPLQSSVFDGASLERIKLASVWLKELERLCPEQKGHDLVIALMAMRLKELLDKP